MDETTTGYGKALAVAGLLEQQPGNAGLAVFDPKALPDAAPWPVWLLAVPFPGRARRRRLEAELDFERWARAHLAWVLEQIGDLTGLRLGAPRRYTPGQVLSAIRRLIEQLRAERDGYLDEARSRHREADRYRRQLLDLCGHEGIDPGDDPHAALLVHLRGADFHDHPAGQPCNGFCHPAVRS